MTISQSTVFIIIGVIVFVYLAIRVMSVMFFPQFADWLLARKLGAVYQSSRRDGKTIGDAIHKDKLAKREDRYRMLGLASGVQLEIIRAFGNKNPRLNVGAEKMPDDGGGARNLLHGKELDEDGFSSNSTKGLYREDGTLLKAKMPSFTWDALPEKVRNAARSAVLAGEFEGALGPYGNYPNYDIYFSTPGKELKVKIDPEGIVLDRRVGYVSGN